MTEFAGAIDSKSYDVIVVGAGGSGLAAAVSAAESGASVLVLESQQRPGGTSRMAVGSISAAGTHLQKQAGIVDNSNDFITDMELFTADLLVHDNANLRQVLAEQASLTVDWLSQMGVVFVGPYAEPPHRVERMHNAVPGAASIVKRLLIACQSLGVEIQTQSSVSQLHQYADGRVHALSFKSLDGMHRVSARKAVILASGDFSASKTMCSAHLPLEASRAIPINPTNTGEMFDVACKVGAQTLNMQHVFGPQMRFPAGTSTHIANKMPSWPWLNQFMAMFFEYAPPALKKLLAKPMLMAHMSPSEQLFAQGAILVDENGQLLDNKSPAKSIAMTESRRGFIVMPNHVAKKFNALPYFISTAPSIAYAFIDDYISGRPDITFKAKDLETLSTSMGLSNAKGLRQSLSGISADYWVGLGPVQAMLTTTEGSIAINSQCQVMGATGQPIESLYAVGCIGQGGLLLRGHGLHLAWAFTSGRIAGKYAASQKLLKETSHATV